MSLKDASFSALEVIAAAIPDAGSITDPINLGGLRLFGVVMPADWTAANLTFQMSPDGGASWANLKDQTGNEITAVVSASDCVVVDPAHFAAMPFLRIRSGTAASPVVQSAERTIKLILRAV